MDRRNFPCQICAKTFKNKSSRTRHERVFHKLSARLSSFICNECNTNFGSLALISKHCETVHKHPVARFCIYCNTVFISLPSYFNHVQDVHGLPSSAGMQTGVEPSATACSGSLKVYNIPIEGHEIDLLQFLLSQKEIIYEIISQNVRNNA